ncbi:HIT domain-containing protein [bacterium]|nr:HIT domain-containing protein [bacterium]
MNDCIFCKIANKEIPSEFIYENDYIFVIRDINPKAPTHLLVITKEHFANLNEINDEKILTEIFKGIKEVCSKLNIKEYKTLINTGKSAGQEVFHFHAHILSDN